MNLTIEAVPVHPRRGGRETAMENGTMRAWVLEEPGRLALRSIAIPEAKDDQLLVKIDRACICNGSDPGIYHGRPAYETPCVFGHEGSGRIVKAGKDAGDFCVGERVFWWFEMGSFAEYQAITPSRTAVFRLPESFGRDEAPVMELVMAACRALMRRPACEGRRRLLICGLGPSGLVLLQYARKLGYTHIAGWDLYPARRELALRLGADEVFDPRELTPEAIGRMEPADCTVLMYGDDKLPGDTALDLAMLATRPYGLVVSYGHPEHGARFSPYLFQSRNLTLVPPENDLAVIRKEGKQVVELAARGEINVTALISLRMSFDALGDVFRDLLEHPDVYGKVVYHWEEETL